MRCRPDTDRVSSFVCVAAEPCCFRDCNKRRTPGCGLAETLLGSAPLDQNTVIVILGEIGLDLVEGGEIEALVRGV